MTFHVKLAQQLKKTFVATCAKVILRDLVDATTTYEIKNGRYEDIPEEQTHARNEYESGLDDAVEAALEPYAEAISANWLGVNTVGTDLWLDDEVTVFDFDDPAHAPRARKLAESAANDIYKSLTHDNSSGRSKTALQVFASAGMTEPMIEDAFRAHITGKNQEETMADTNKEYDAVIAKLHGVLGKDFDLMTVFADVDDALYNDDELVRNAAADRLQLTGEDCDNLLSVALVVEDPVQRVVDDLTNFKPKRKRQSKKAQPTDIESGMGGVLQALKRNGVGDTAMAERLGVSRSTYTKYIKGTLSFVPDVEQQPMLREELVGRVNDMLAALAKLDGTEPAVVA